MRNICLLLLGLWLSGTAYGQSLPAPTLLFADTASLTVQTTGDGEIQWKWGLDPDALLRHNSTSGNLLQLTGLQPATVYYIQAIAVRQDDTLRAPVTPFITSACSPGEMKVYFNFPVDASYSNGALPATTSASDMEAQIIDLILSATSTIDVCMYNVDRDYYISALKQAAANGVRVRYIAEGDRPNPSLQNTSLNFPVLYAVSNGIMHNKFLIIDKDLPDKALVLTGSFNFTYSNLAKGYNNAITIRDQSLAEIYTMEFEEMWGGTGDQPNATAAKFGSAKTDNTPHSLFINGVPVEVYFSPSDQTTSHLVDAVQSADHDLRFALLAFTNDDLENALLNQTVPIRGLIENQYNGTITDQFQAAGLAIYDYEEPNRFLHHKYLIVDAEATDSDPFVATGSHNWTYSAEHYNDENTLIIHDADIANIYVQEFEARWQTIVATAGPVADGGIRLYPNPASEILTVSNNLPAAQTVVLSDCLGREWQRVIVPPGSSRTLNISHMPTGFYLLRTADPKAGSMRWLISR